MEGFVVFDYAERYARGGRGDRRLDRRGQDQGQGARRARAVDDFPETLQMLFRGENVGKLVLELA